MSDPDPQIEPLDGQLLRQYLQGKSSAALGQLVRRHVDFVYSVARRQVRDAHLAEDVCQNVFLLLMKKAASLLEHPNLGGWLFQTTMLASRNLTRARSRETARLAKLSQQTSLQDQPMP